MALTQQWGKVGISYQEDGWYGKITRSLTFVQAAVLAQAIASYRNATFGVRNGMIVGFVGDPCGYLFVERIAEVLAGNDVIVWLCEEATIEDQLRRAIDEQGLDGGVLVTGSENEVHGLKFLAPAHADFTVNQIERYVREIEQGVCELQVKPYAQATREGALLLCAFQN